MISSQIQTGAPAKIMFIRHAEKMVIPKEMKDALPPQEKFSIDLALSLSMLGEARAQALAVLFSQDRFMQHYLSVLQKRIILEDEKEIEAVCHGHLENAFRFNEAFTVPDVIIAAYPTPNAKRDPSDHYIRTVQTVKPLAKNLGIEIVKKYHIRDTPIKGPTFVQDEFEFYKPMARDLLNNYPGQVILICWEHKRISFLAKSLGVSDEVFEILEQWSTDRFDQVWAINFERDGLISSVENFSQNIMQGDSLQAPKRYQG